MEQYPSFTNNIQNKPIIAFDKLDGSNIRAEWTRKNGFNKFGSRRRLIDANDPLLGESIEIFMEKYSKDLENIYRKERYDKTTVFFEFYGPNSFAGQHINEKHDVTVFDLHVFKKGILPAKDFLKLFENKIEIPNIVYSGNPNQNFIKEVKASSLPGVTFEGVMCKGEMIRNKPVVFKVKSDAWINKLKNKYGENSKEFHNLL